MKILITNDDGYKSPLLAVLIRFLKNYGELVVVAPKHEQSWTGKSMTRFSDLELESGIIEGTRINIINGTTPDCVNIGIYNLCDGNPDLVVSGINIGRNAGFGFVMSSATIGGAIEANIAGVPAIALSQIFDSAVRDFYLSTFTLPDEVLEKLTIQLNSYMKNIFDKVAANIKKLTEPVIWNFNFPYNSASETKIFPAKLSGSTYGRCHTRDGNKFLRQIVDIHNQDLKEDSDTFIAKNNHATLTKLDFRALGQEVNGVGFDLFC